MTRVRSYGILQGATLSCGHDIPPEKVEKRGDWYEPVLCLECPSPRRKRRVRNTSYRWEARLGDA